MFENRICFLLVVFLPLFKCGRLGTSELPWSLWSSAWLPFAEKAQWGRGSEVSHGIYGEIIPKKMPIFFKAGSVFFQVSFSGPMMSEDSNFGGHGTLFGSSGFFFMLIFAFHPRCLFWGDDTMWQMYIQLDCCKATSQNGRGMSHEVWFTICLPYFRHHCFQ